MSEWWTIESCGMIFGIIGAACGVLGGVYGSVVGLLVPRGRGKPVVYGVFGLLVALALAGLALGVSARMMGQPQHVWMWPALLGATMLMATLPSGFLIPSWYRKAEQRRLEAGELRRSS